MIRARSGLAGIVALALLAGCQPPPAARLNPYQDLLAPGIYPAQAAEQLPIAGHDRSLAVVISSSTEHQFQYLKEAVKAGQTIPLLGVASDGQKAAPDYLVQRIVSKLRQHFARVQPADDFGQAVAGHADYIALVDIGVTYPAGIERSFTYDVSVELLTPRIERIGAFRGYAHQGYLCIEPACAEKAQSVALETALAQYDAAVDGGIQ